MPHFSSWLREIDTTNDVFKKLVGRLYMCVITLPRWHPMWPNFELDAYWFLGDNNAYMGPAVYDLFKVGDYDQNEPFRYSFRDILGRSSHQHDTYGRAGDIKLVENVNDWYIKLPWSVIHSNFILEGTGAKNLYAGLYASAPKMIDLRARRPEKCFDFMDTLAYSSYP